MSREENLFENFSRILNKNLKYFCRKYNILYIRPRRAKRAEKKFFENNTRIFDKILKNLQKIPYLTN